MNGGAFVLALNISSPVVEATVPVFNHNFFIVDALARGDQSFVIFHQ